MKHVIFMYTFAKIDIHTEYAVNVRTTCNNEKKEYTVQLLLKDRNYQLR